MLISQLLICLRILEVRVLPAVIVAKGHLPVGVAAVGPASSPVALWMPATDFAAAWVLRMSCAYQSQELVLGLMSEFLGVLDLGQQPACYRTVDNRSLYHSYYYGSCILELAFLTTFGQY
jgi:hypothetical protein